MKDSIIIVSGGMDSITMLYEYKDRIDLGLTFDYGSKHNNKEIYYAAIHCKRLNIKHLIISVDFIKKYFSSSLLENGDDIPEGSYNINNMKSTSIPFRNGIMLSIAAGIAETKNLKYVMIANHHGDHSLYPDCSESFINAMNHAVTEGTYANIKIFAPYTNISKTDIALTGKKLGIDYSETWSCYKGNEFQCGKCGTCIERIEALKNAGIHDHTKYANNCKTT